MRPADRAIALALFFLLCCGCSQATGVGEADLTARNYLQLEGYTLVADETLRGYLRWIYFADDPERISNPRVACEIWEELDMAVVELTDACSGCSLQLEGTASEHEDTTCSHMSWSYRTLSLSYSPIEDAAPPASDYSSDGYTHVVGSRWSPDEGEGEVFQPVFVAQPDQWDPAEGEAGAGLGEAPSGQYHLLGLYYWDL